MYVCMYVCMHVYIPLYIYTYTDMYVPLYISLSLSLPLPPSPSMRVIRTVSTDWAAPTHKFKSVPEALQ